MWRIAAAGDTALLVSLGEAMTPATLAEVLALDRALRRKKPPGLLTVIPAYASLLCSFDPGVTDASRLADAIRTMKIRPRPAAGERVLDVPTRYDGPDLGRIAGHTGLSTEEVVALHTGVEYLVYCLGFAPGFTYCGELPETLATPRLPSPRARVPAGSVGIAGRQTGIYAVESPGGWNLIGRTNLPLFDPKRDPPAYFRPGDRVRFQALA